MQWLLVKVDRNIYWGEIPQEVQDFKNNVTLGKNFYFFGDSVTFFSGNEGDPRTIPNFLEAEMGISVTPVTHSAYHLGIFQDYVSQLPKGPSCPAVVIEINLRSFSEAWKKRPEYQYEKERFFINNYDNRWFRVFWKPLAIFKFFNLETYTPEEFRATPVIRHGIKIGTMQDFYDLERIGEIDELRKVAFNYDYLYDLNTADPKIVALSKIVSLRRACKKPTVIYVTPVDYQSGEYYWGKAFTEQIKANTKTIGGIANQEGILFADWSTIYESDQFMWRETNYPDEHLKAIGRDDIAKRIASYLHQTENN